MDAAHRAELDGPVADRVGVLPRPRCLPAAAADHALHAHRRRAGRSPRSPADAAGLAVHPDGDGSLPGGPRLLRRRRDLAHPAALVHDRPRPGIRRPGLSGAHPVARRQERSAERGRAQLDSVQHRARARPARLRRDDCRLREMGLRRTAGHGRLLRPERAVVPGRHLRADVAAREAHSADRRRQHARRAAHRPLVRPAITAAWWRSSCSRRRRRSWGLRC